MLKSRVPSSTWPIRAVPTGKNPLRRLLLRLLQLLLHLLHLLLLPPPATAGDSAKGKSVYESSCAACHTAGVAGAPKTGDKAAWAPRLKTGKDALYASVIKGKGAMPPKGGNASLADADIKAAVDYLTGLAK